MNAAPLQLLAHFLASVRRADERSCLCMRLHRSDRVEVSATRYSSCGEYRFRGDTRLYSLFFKCIIQFNPRVELKLLGSHSHVLFLPSFFPPMIRLLACGCLPSIHESRPRRPNFCCGLLPVRH